MQMCGTLPNLFRVLLTHLYKGVYFKDILGVLSALRKKGYKLKPRCPYDIFFFYHHHHHYFIAIKYIHHTIYHFNYFQLYSSMA